MGTREITEKKTALILSDDAAKADRLADVLDGVGVAASAAPMSVMDASGADFGKYDLILVWDTGDESSIIDFLREMQSRILTSIVPVIVASSPGSFGSRGGRLLEGARCLMPADLPARDVAELINGVISKVRSETKDPVTGLVTGAPLTTILESKCTKSQRQWYFLVTRIIALRGFNYAYGYDKGDVLLREIADIVDEAVRDQGEADDFAGRLSGTALCAVSSTRRIDTLCRSILVRTERLIRRHYSPFEITKGYLTVEDDTYGGNYQLCEVHIAAVRIPASWDNNHVLLFDIVEEVLADVDKNETGYQVISF